MRLYTEVSDFGDGDVLVIGNADVPVSMDDQLEHDAAAAHALRKAVDEYGFEFLTDRAAELMREWGFEEMAG